MVPKFLLVLILAIVLAACTTNIYPTMKRDERCPRISEEATAVAMFYLFDIDPQGRMAPKRGAIPLLKYIGDVQDYCEGR